MAVPVASVVAIAIAPPPANVPLGPLPGAVNVTTTPIKALPPLSFTMAFKAAKGALIATLCGVPAEVMMVAGGALKLVNSNAAAVATPLTVALTLYVPEVAFAANAGAVATPFAVVLMLTVAPPPAKVPLGPEPGAVKVTVAPGTAFPPASFTMACRFVAKVVLIVVLCGVPAVAVMVAGGPTLFMREKLAGAKPPTVAVTT